MKKYISILMAITGLAIMANTSWAITMSDVISVDKLITAATLSDSGDATELAWVNTVLGTTYTTMKKYDTPDGAGWVAVDGESGVYAIDFLSESPGYFFIKVGAGKKDPPYTHYLYENLASLNWGVINLSVNEDITIKEIGKFSHIGELGETAVPEPATLILLGLGLLGIAGIRRKK